MDTNLTPLYDRWLAHLVVQDRVTLLLTGAAVLVILTIAWAQARHRSWMLDIAVVGFVGLLVCLLVYEEDGNVIRSSTFGLLMGQPLWYDEAFTWAVARLPLDRMMIAIAGDVHPPLWYLIERLTIRLVGDSEVALRSPALAFGLVGLWLTFRLGVAMGYSRRLSGWAAVLLAVLPGWIYYSQEARMYTLLACGVLTAAIGLVMNRNWLMALGMVITLYTQTMGVFYVVVIAALSLWYALRGDISRRDRYRPARAFVATLCWLVCVGVIWIPWLTVLAQQLNDVGDGFWIPDRGFGGYLLELYRVMMLVGVPEFLQVHAALVTVGLLSLMVWLATKDRRGWVFFISSLGPVMLMAMVSEVWRPVYLHRAILPSLPFVALAAVAALDRITIQRSVILCALVPVLMLAFLGQRKENIGTISTVDLVDHVSSVYHSGDVIYHANLSSYILLSYYLQEPSYRRAVWPDAGNLSQALSLPTQQAMCVPRMTANQALKRADRLLVLWVENPMTTRGEIENLEETLAAGISHKLVDIVETELACVHLWEVRANQGESEGAR